MENIWGSGQASATATAEVRMPAYRPNDIAAGIKQPTEPVVRFAWVIERLGGNKKYECKLCRCRFTGQKTMVITHFESNYSLQRISKCMAIQPRELVEEIKKSMLTKKKEEEQKSNKRMCSTLSSTSDIGIILKGQGKPLADTACLEFIVSQGLSASIVEAPAFRNMIMQVFCISNICILYFWAVIERSLFFFTLYGTLRYSFYTVLSV